ncbi:MAG: biotin/lipoyl-binding protein [Cyanobacteria bacterium P01_D01_bin.44]
MPPENVSPDSPVDQASVDQAIVPIAPAQTQVTESPASEPTATERLALPGFRKPKKPLWPAVALAMLVVAGFVGWRVYRALTATPADETTAIADPARLPVRVVTAETGLAQGWVFDEGSVWPVQRRLLNFQASGDITYIAKVNGVELKEGDFVSQGQLLATIDARRQQSSIDTAAADIEVSVSQRNQSEADLSKAQANLEKAKSDLALAKTELRRSRTLFEEGALAESDRDVAQNQVDQAEAALKTAQQDVLTAENGVRSAEAQIGASQARLNETNVDLEDTQLVSPIDGVVAYINIREGEYWSTQYLNTSSPQDVIESAPIVVVDPQSFEVELELQADEAGEIQPGQQAYVVLEEEVSAAQASGTSSQGLLEIAKQRGSGGQVFAVSPSQTPGSRGTEITIRDLEQVRNLRVGGRVYVWIEVASTRDAVVLPLGALLSRDQQFYAFVVNEADGTVQRRRVTRGIEGLSGVEILSGVEPGEKVVIEGQNRLVNGTPVEMVNRE